MRTWTARRAICAAISVVAATAVVAAGCGDDDKKSTAKPASFAMEATAQGKKKLALSVPASVPAGLVTMTLKNSDMRPRSASIVRVVGDHSIDDVLKADAAPDGAPIPEWLEDGGGISTVPPGATSTVTQNLAPGRYVVTDDTFTGEEGPSNAELGAKGEFTVTGEASDAELPSVPATITTTDKGDKDYGFTFKGLKAGTNQVRFENTGEQLHHALIFPYTKGATLEDAKKFAESDAPPTGPPPFDFMKGVSTAVIDGGIAQNIEFDLTAGKYVVLCFVPDRKGGKSHVEKGMIEELEIK